MLGGGQTGHSGREWNNVLPEARQRFKQTAPLLGTPYDWKFVSAALRSKHTRLVLYVVAVPTSEC